LAGQTIILKRTWNFRALLIKIKKLAIGLII